MTKFFQRKRRAVVATALLVAVSLVTADGSELIRAADWKPGTPPSIYPVNAGSNPARRKDYIVDVCTTDTQLDCVESIEAYLNNTWVKGVASNTANNGADNVPTSRNWTIPGVTGLNNSTELTVTHVINYTGNLLLQTTISPNGTQGDRDANSLPRDTKFKATVRTSWVLPTHVSGKFTDAKITVTKMAASGASKISMEGTPLIYMVISNDAVLTDPAGKGDYEVRDYSMTVSDGRFYPIKQDCIEKTPIMTSENGYGHPLPTFTNGNLDLKISAPHFRSDGTTKHTGIYEALVPIDMARCLWGNSIDTTSKFEMKVFETDGTTKAATTSVEVTADAVVIRASGFTFSTPTVRVSYTAPVVATSTTTTTTTIAASTSSSSTTSSTSTTPPTTTTTIPAKPSGVKATPTKGGGTVTFTRVKGLSYAAVATKGKVRKVVRCTLGPTKVTCRATGLAAGSWKLTVTPRSGSTTGTSHTATLRVS